MEDTTHERRRADREIEALLIQIRTLVAVREILEEHRASAAEIEEHAREADRLRGRLAVVVARRHGYNRAAA